MPPKIIITIPSVHLPICLVICKSEMYKVKLNWHYIPEILIVNSQIM